MTETWVAFCFVLMLVPAVPLAILLWDKLMSAVRRLLRALHQHSAKKHAEDGR